MVGTLIPALPLVALIPLIAAAVFLVVRGADLLVDEAVALALCRGIPTVLVGATIVSLGTTLPEVSVSTVAALTGTAEVAMGNAVGWIICNFGLILGLAILIAPPRIDRASVNLHGRIQLGSIVLLGATVLLFRIADGGGRVPQAAGILYLLLLALYLAAAVMWSKRGTSLPVSAAEPVRARAHPTPDLDPTGAETPCRHVLRRATLVSAGRLFGGIALVVGGSRVLVPAVQETALRFGVPEGVVAATMVAFGTSVPELFTAVTASRKGHGELAVGNVIGANILNVLFVVGTAAAILPGGLTVSAFALSSLIPSALVLTMILRLGVLFSRRTLSRWLGAILLAGYIAITIGSYLLNAPLFGR